MISRRRQKGFFAIVILSSCVIYFNWLVNINDWTYTSKEILSKRIGKKNDKRQNQILDDYVALSHKIDTNDDLEEINNLEINFKNKVMLLAANEERGGDGGGGGGENNFKSENFSQKDLAIILSLLYTHKAFIVDTHLLNYLLKTVTTKISAKEFLPGFNNKIKTFDLLKLFYENGSTKTLLTYGIFIDDYERLNKVCFGFFLKLLKKRFS
jgi:hypothetical protein